MSEHWTDTDKLETGPFFAAQGDDDGFWYVYREFERTRPDDCRNPCVILFEDEWPDGGKSAAIFIAEALNAKWFQTKASSPKGT